MSCGKYHETPCHEVLERMYMFLDSEMDTGLTYEAVEQHLGEQVGGLHHRYVRRAG